MTASNDTTIRVPLTQGKSCIIDTIDADLARLKWSYSHYGYAVRIKDTRNNRSGLIRMHRLILERVIGRELLKSELGDHINGDTCDNRRRNLRVASPIENARNTRAGKNNQSGYKGVHLCKSTGRWRAQITVNRKAISLGYFDTPELAAKAYNDAAIKYYDKFAKLNEF